MARSTVFKTNCTQSIRLPKSVAFPDEVRDVEIIRLGHSRPITPAERRWDDLFLNEPVACEDFMNVREQFAVEERKLL